MKILIPYDGSDSARAALDDLPRAGLTEAAEALVLVTPVWLASSPTEFSRAVAWRRVLAAEGSSFTPALRGEEEERALAREASRLLRAQFPAWRVKTQAARGAGTVGPELVRRAVSWGADFIVIGSDARSWHDPSFGAAPRAVIAVAPCAVRVARPTAAARTGPLRLLVGADADDDEPGSVLRAVASREWPAGSECRVVSPGPVRPGDAEALREAGLKVSAVEPAGQHPRALLGEAERWGADCIFVASGSLEGEAGAGDLVAPLFAGSPCSFEVTRPSPRPAAVGLMPGGRDAVRVGAAGAR